MTDRPGHIRENSLLDKLLALRMQDEAAKPGDPSKPTPDWCERGKSYAMCRDEAEIHLEDEISAVILTNPTSEWQFKLSAVIAAWKDIPPAMQTRIAFLAIARASRIGDPLPEFVLLLAQIAFDVKPRRNGEEQPMALLRVIHEVARNPKVGNRTLEKIVGISHEKIRLWRRSSSFARAVENRHLERAAAIKEGLDPDEAAPANGK